MDLNKSFPTFSQMRFSIVHLLVLTTAVAFFVVVLFNENEWLRATYVTVISGIVMHELVAAICSRGERQYFSLGFICCLPIHYVGMYGYSVTLPYLITIRMHEFLKASGTSMPNEEHFLGVMASFWILLTSYCLGKAGQYWYRRAKEGRESASSGEMSISNN